MNGKAQVAYRSDKQFYLPKFGAAKNPFNKTPESAPAKKESPAAQKISAAPIAPQPTPTVASRFSPAPAPMVRPPQLLMSGVPVVQTELSLDAIKVVHNDLSDAEVEVIPLKSRGDVAELPPARRSWEILGERLLKATTL
ncbi:MAG TPA: hypothetical protein VGN23_05455 [Verrucomicrobiae bacterium]